MLIVTVLANGCYILPPEVGQFLSGDHSPAIVMMPTQNGWMSGTIR